MYHSPSRKTRLLQRFIGLAITISAVIVGVSIVTALTLGYGLNKEDGRIEQGGILQLGSTPSGAKVTINGVPFSSQTPTKMIAYEGDYAIKMQLPKYKTWQKTVPVQSGEITWQTYARLFPKEINPVHIATFDSMDGALPSGSGENYALLPDSSDPIVTIAPLTDDEVELKTVEFPSTLLTELKQPKSPVEYELKLWNGEENYILIKRTYDEDKKVEWLILDTESPEDSINLTKSYGVDATQVVFSSYSGRQLVVLIDGAIRQIDLDAETLSRPFVRDVNNFRLYGDGYILYVTNPSKENSQKIGYMRKEFENPVVIKEVPYNGKTTALVDFGKYFDKYYILMSYDNTAALFEMEDFTGLEEDKISLRRVVDMGLKKPITTLDITDNSQFATIQDGYSFSNYNLELTQLTVTKIESTSDQPQKLRHLDTYLYWGVDDGHLRTYEFDGANQNRLMSLESTLDATLSPTGKYLYSVSSEDNKFHLQRIQILGL